jgi:hypothetical protein
MLSDVGCVNYYRIFIFTFGVLLSFIVITYVQYISANPVKHRHFKHIEIDIHFIRENVCLGQVRVLHVPSSHQLTYIMTRGLPTTLF